MDRLVIRGGRRIEGSVQICGAKNAALPQIAAALLSPEPLTLGNVPEVADVNTMLALMRELTLTGLMGDWPCFADTMNRVDS
jgi:UDP-N-acetylglucosamine 1-carboxyvinyltransferase